MFVVTRTFRDANGIFSAGTIVEPAEIKAFKSRFQQRHIVDVNEHNIQIWQNYFQNRYGIALADVFTQYLAGQPVDQSAATESTPQIVAPASEKDDW